MPSVHQGAAPCSGPTGPAGPATGPAARLAQPPAARPKLDRLKSIFKGYLRKTGHLVRIFHAKSDDSGVIQYTYDETQTQVDLFFFSSLLNQLLNHDELVGHLFLNRTHIETLLFDMMTDDSMTLHSKGFQVTAITRPTLQGDHKFDSLPKSGKADEARSMLRLLRNDLVHNIDFGVTTRQTGKYFGNVCTTCVRYHLFEILCFIFGIKEGNVFNVSKVNW